VGEVLDPTWIAFASRRPIAPERVEVAVERVSSHYAETAGGPLRRDLWHAGNVGLVCLTDSSRTCSWPGWTEDRSHACAFGYVPTGWRRIVATSDPAGAALELAAAVDGRPELAARELDAPAVLAIANREARSLTIVNDCLGAGRLFEMEAGDVNVWSNRLGALPLLLGNGSDADAGAWRLFAAMGWFIRDATPIAGARRVRPGTVIRTDGATVERRRTGAIEAIVGGADEGFEAHVGRFVDEATEAASAAYALYPDKPRVDVSGGRDSRLSAAVFVAADVPARFVTSDMTPGEADVARRLFGAVEGEHDHNVRWGGKGEKVYAKGLRARALAVHRVHDGMRHASKVRGRMELPPTYSRRAEISGHGGEIAHGFYYTTQRALSKLGDGGDALIARLDQAARRRHDAALEACYEAAREACGESLAEGSAAGLSGPTLLDWFYLMERFTHRSGLAADAQRITFFSCRGFLSAAFALTPEQRLANELHLAATAALVPEWSQVPYFQARRGFDWSLRTRLRRRYRDEKRPMIWEGADGAEMEGMIDAAGVWTTMYDEARVREIWSASRDGHADAHYQDVFEGIAYRESFEDHLALLTERAERGIPLVEAAARPLAQA